jgi:hypothetical protein
MRTEKMFDSDRHFTLFYVLSVAFAYAAIVCAIEAADHFLPLPSKLETAFDVGALLGLAWMAFLYFMASSRK